MYINFQFYVPEYNTHFVYFYSYNATRFDLSNNYTVYTLVIEYYQLYRYRPIGLEFGLTRLISYQLLTNHDISLVERSFFP